jgi:hypothetical protein
VSALHTLWPLISNSISSIFIAGFMLLFHSLMI